MLQREGRVAYRVLKIRFHLTDDYLEGLKDELIEAKRQATDENGKVLVWVDAAPVPSAESPPTPNPQPLTKVGFSIKPYFADSAK